MAERIVSFSLTEVPHFNRLVDFLAQVHDYAETVDDWQLQDLVDQCRTDLAQLLKD